ncbi:hypothetical protein L596_028314 [Steinernema carpocapsae]|uniref:non-specific serine/threonine protein kinase n=1 Tax=Steinernema carpocapsae TaxID=34508 RepID=A0A4U5LY49_STECR|nr:hypothetical protein L596_028314 [Steinernema carpocapsae]
MQSVNASNNDRFIAYGEQLLSRFAVLERIGSGGYGQIYRGEDSSKGLHVAVKVEEAFTENSTHDPRRMVVEHKVLREVRGKPHFPVIYAAGKSEKGCAFIVMELLGENLTAVRKAVPNQRFSVSTLFRIAQQIVLALEALHNLNYIHRDIKPTNCCIGRTGEARKRVYLIDFGFCRKFRNSKGDFKASRQDAGFRGTVRYASERTLLRSEAGPADDLISWMYAVVEMGTDELPWTREEEMTAVLKKKREIKNADLCRELPRKMASCVDHLRSLKYDDKGETKFLGRAAADGDPRYLESGVQEEAQREPSAGFGQGRGSLNSL